MRSYRPEVWVSVGFGVSAVGLGYLRADAAAGWAAGGAVLALGCAWRRRDHLSAANYPWARFAAPWMAMVALGALAVALRVRVPVAPGAVVLAGIAGAVLAG